MNPLISVLIPAYNAEKYISKSVESVINQSYSNFELIIIDDGSTDRTVEKINQFKDERIRLYTQTNSGQCKTLNYALRMARGEWIKFLDADDFVNEHHLEKMIAAINTADDGKTLVLCKWQRFQSDGSFSPETQRPEWSDSKPVDFLLKALGNGPDMLPAWQWLISRKTLERVGVWNESLGLGNDFEFSVRLILGSDEIKFSPEAVVYYRSDLKSNMSSSTSSETIMSVLEASRLGIKHMQSHRDGGYLLKKVCAYKLKVWLHTYYPYIRASLVKEVEKEIAALGDPTINMGWSDKMSFLNKLIGWKTARLLQFYYYKARHR